MKEETGTSKAMDDDVASKQKARKEISRHPKTEQFLSTHPVLRRCWDIVLLQDERLNGERNWCRTQETRTQQRKATRTLKKEVRGNFRDI